jgi:hypothetical protein
MEKAIIFIFSWWLMTCISHAQSSTRGIEENQFGLQIGLSGNQMQEGSLNKVLHSGIGFHACLFREKISERKLKRFEFLLSPGFLKSDYESEISSFHFQTSCNYRYMFRFLRNRSRLGFFVGGIVSADANIQYFDNWDENHFYWLTAYSVGIDFRIELQTFRKNKLQIEGNIPLISLVSRTPKHFMNTQASSSLLNVVKKMHENPRISHTGRNLSFNLLLRYVFQKTENSIPNLFWQFHLIKNTLQGSGKFRSMNHTIGIELIF